MTIADVSRRIVRKFMRPSRQDVIEAYRLIFRREPDNEAVITANRQLRSPMEVVKGLVNSEEYLQSQRLALTDEEIDDIVAAIRQGRPASDETAGTATPALREELVAAIAQTQRYKTDVQSSVFYHYNARFDAVSLINSYEAPDRQPVDGHKVNFFGVAVPKKVLPAHVVDSIPDVERNPLPANWHADIAEFAAALRAVALAKNTFSMIELGCGWGCWMNITGVAAKRKGLTTKVIGVEGDPTHVDFATETLDRNGFAENERALFRGIAGAREGVALFPTKSADVEDWGLEPVFDPTPEQRAALAKGGTYEELPVFGLEKLMGDLTYVDLVHIDIQGGERDFVANSIDALNARVGYLVIGTHSRPIEGALFETLLTNGWELEIERPAVIDVNGTAPVTLVDGVQGWRNPRVKRA